jgi:hypothetical protein
MRSSKTPSDWARDIVLTPTMMATQLTATNRLAFDDLDQAR